MARRGNVGGHGRAAGEHHVVGQRQVRRDHAVAAGHEATADRRRSRHHEAGRVEAVLAQVAVVRDVADVVDLGARADVRGRERRAVDRAIAADLHLVADADVAQVRELLRPAARARRRSRSRRCRCWCAGALRSRGPARSRRPRRRAGAAACWRRAGRRSRPPSASRCSSRLPITALAPITQYGPEVHVGADRGRLVHDGGRVPLAPLREALALAVEMPQQQGHAHRDVLDREAAAEGAASGSASWSSRSRLHDQDRGPAFAGRGELRSVADEDEAGRPGRARHVALRGGGVEIAVQVREDVGVLGLDGLCAEHRASSSGGHVREARRRAVTLPSKSSHWWLAKS